MDRTCPSCFGREFSIIGHVTFVGACNIEVGGELHFFDDDEIMWDTQVTTFIECHACGWGVDVNLNQQDVASYLAPTLDPGVEDLPDEEEIDAPISSDTGRKNQDNILSESY